MQLLTANRNTVFKKTAAPVGRLPGTDVANVRAGDSFNVQYAFQVGQHCFVRLQDALGTVGKIGYFPLSDVHVPIQEARGVWLTTTDSDVLKSKSNIQAGLKQLKGLGFNTIYPVVWQSGFTLFPSAVAASVIGSKIMPDPAFAGRNMLAEIVDEAKTQGFRVIPWFEYGLMTPPGSQLAITHPDWLTAVNDKGDTIRTKRADREKDDQVWLNPCRPEVQQFMVDLIAEVAEQYDVDGVQLDDHFGFPVELGYDRFTQNLFKAENSGAAAPKDHTDPKWVDWASGKVTDLLRRIFHAVKAKRPDCLISISPNPLSFSKEHYLADWNNWVQAGLAEEIVLQVYRDTVTSFRDELLKPEVSDTHDHIPLSIGVLSGLRTQRVAFALIENQIKESRNRSYTGVSCFFYETLFNETLTPSKARNLSDLKTIFP